MTTQTLEIPLLPLTDTVLFPRTLLTLKIVEPRYKQLVEDALKKDGEIGVILLQPGWERDWAEKSRVFSTGGLGVIVDHKRKAEDEMEVLIQGVHRFAVEEQIQTRPYRIARVRLLEEVTPARCETRKTSRLLVRYFREIAKAVDSHTSSLARLHRLDYQTLVNSICAWLNFSVYEKQRLLEIEDLRQRGELVLEILRGHVYGVRLLSRFRHLQPADSRFN
ncbi:MAG: LON peptidase substrate-binding domain-containing protein [Acidobacteriota bacterium]